MRRTVIAVFLLGGCAAAPSQAELRDLRTRLDASEQQRSELSRKLEELDNRVFLLTDQVESQKVALSQKGGEPRLPVITLSPPPVGVKETLLGAPPPRDPNVLNSPDDDAPIALDPPTEIREGNRGHHTTTIKMEGDATPWLEDGRDPPPRAIAVAPRGRRSRGNSQPSSRPAPPPIAPVIAAAHSSPGSPPVEEGLGVTHGKPPLVDQVVAGVALPIRGATPVSIAPVNSAPDDGEQNEPTALYRAAYARMKSGQQVEAAEEFRRFVVRFPHHDLADNAQYWLGETFYARGAYKEAAPEFRSVLRRWPSGNKAPDALLKLGYCLLQDGDPVEGRSALSQVVEHYPRTEAAALAQRRLGELSTESPK